MIIQRKINSELKLPWKDAWIDFLYMDDYTEARDKTEELQKIDPKSNYRLVDIIW
jgi:hypothetical protein